MQGSEESHAPGKGANDAKEALMSVVAPLHLMRYVLSRPIGEEDWKRINSFYTYIKSGDTICKLMEVVVLVSMSALERTSLKA